MAKNLQKLIHLKDFCFAIKHRRTKPSQTNGKRFWRTYEVIDGAQYQTLDELKDAVVGYNFYYT